jgi:hypothetical protein
MPYIPPLCETTGLLITRRSDTKLNGTTTVKNETVILNALRYIQLEPSKFLQDENGYQSAEIYRLYLQNPDSLTVGDQIRFNYSKYMLKTLYNSTLTDTVLLEVKQIENNQIGCEGYIEAICVTYN